MAYTAPPARTALADTYPNPSNATFKTGIGALWDFVTNLLGTSGNPEGAFDGLKLIDSEGIWNLRPIFSVGSNALTITVKGNDNVDLGVNNPGYVHMRNASLSDSTITRRKLTANIAHTISSGSTGGHTSAEEGLLYWYLIENGSGGIEIAWASQFMGLSGRFTTTAEGGAGAADSGSTMYSTTARTNQPGRLAWITRDTQTVAGTWTSLPTEVIYPPFNENNIGTSNPNGIQTLNDVASIVWNLNKGRKAQVTLAGNRALANPVGPIIDGESYFLWVVQDATGSRTLSFGTDYFFPGGIDPTLTLGAGNAIDLLHFVGRSGKLYGSFGADMK